MILLYIGKENHHFVSCTLLLGSIERPFCYSKITYSPYFYFCTGWIWQAPPTVLHQHRHLFAVLQCSEPFIFPECDREMGPWNPMSLPQGPYYSRRDPIGPPRRRQSTHWAWQMQREACGGGGRKALCRGNKSRLLHRMLRFDSEKPQRSLWCSHCGWHSLLGYSATAKEIQKQDSRQDEKPLQVLVEKILLFCIGWFFVFLQRPWKWQFNHRGWFEVTLAENLSLFQSVQLRSTPNMLLKLSLSDGDGEECELRSWGWPNWGFSH